MQTEVDYASDGGDNKSEESFAEGETSNAVTVPAVPDEAQRPKSNLLHVLQVIRSFLSRFKSQPLHFDKSNAQILERYPKYLSKFSLLNLQFNDSLFRETFYTQVLIFL
jgi:hypothetical protein